MTDQLILVTGASGYIACHVVEQLQRAGYRVRGTVRSLDNEEKTAPLKQLVPDAKHPLQLVAADLNSEQGWDKAVEGCYAVIHTASPFPNLVERKITEEEVIGPAVQGTIFVLKAAAQAGVSKVVLTSSAAAIMADGPVEENKTWTEEDWNDPDGPHIQAYSKSKVAAEKAAWSLLEELADDKKFTLSVINPTFVMGPPLLASHRSATSVIFMKDILNHKIPGVPRVMIPLCDVRDVAKAHVEALSNSEAYGKRHLISTDSYWMKDINTIVSEEFRPQGYKIATTHVPYFFVWMASFVMDSVKNQVLPKVGASLSIDNSRMSKVLGITPTKIEDTLLDMAYALIDLNMVAKSKKYKQVGSRAETPAAVASDGEKQPQEAVEEQDKEKDAAPATDDAPNTELEPQDKEKTPEEAKKEENGTTKAEDGDQS